MNSYSIPFNRPSFVGREQQYLLEAAKSGVLSGNGPFTARCEAFLENHLKTTKAFLTPSGTHALELAALLLNLKPGDEVIVPSFTFVSTANAFALRGAKPVFIDIRPDTLNLDDSLLSKLITPRTKAVVPVHYAGVACEMKKIVKIAREFSLTVIEDNAHGLFGRYDGTFLGAIGDMATLSFHETKNLTCGEGGALLLNDPRLIERAEILREKGTDRRKFFSGQVDQYTWVDFGSNYLLAELLAAVLFAQLEEKEKILGRRAEIWESYHEGLKEWAIQNGVRLPVFPSDIQPSFHMFYLIMPSLDARQALINHLKAKGILSVFHYQPLHLSEMGRRFGGKRGDCPVTEKISGRLLRLPFFNDLSSKDQAFVITAVKEFKT